jgi:DNA-binding NarL/FixJ family response regulator
MSVLTVQNCNRCGKDLESTEKSEHICLSCREPKLPKSEENLHRPVTLRERQVIELVAKGNLNKEIARDLGLSEGTIKEYLYKIFRKIRVTNRTELAVWAFAHPEELMGMTPPH